MPAEFSPLSLPLLAHVFGDAFPKEVEQETASIKDLLQYLVSFLEGLLINPEPFSNRFDVARLQRILQTLEYALQIENRMHDRWLRLAVIKDEEEADVILEEAKHDLYIHLFQLLQYEKNALLAGGWTRKLRGHSMFYEFLREENSHYTFRLYNSQESSEQKISDRGVIEITNLRLKEVIGSNFLRALVEIHLCMQMPSDKIIEYHDTAYSERDIYHGLLMLLKGHLSHKDPILEEIVNPLEKGTAAWKSLCAWFRKHLSYEEYRHLIYKLRYESLKQYAGQKVDLIALHSREPVRQAEELASIKAFADILAEDVQKMTESALLSTSERENARSFLAFLFSGIQKTSQNIQKELQEEIVNLDLSLPVEAHSFKNVLPQEISRKRELLASLKNSSFMENSYKQALPRTILFHPDFYVFFDEDIQAQQIDPFTYWFVDQGLPNYVRLTLFGGIIIQRFFNELGWHQLIPFSLLATLDNKALVNGCTHWISLSAEEDLIVCRIPEKTPSYLIKMKTEITGLEVQNIYRLPRNENEKKLKLIPLDKANKRLISLTKFEDPSYICLWSDSNNRPALIEFLRYNLHFDIKIVNGITIALSKEYPNLYLDSKQSVKILSNFFNYLVLTDEQHKKKILIPRHPIKEQKILLREQKVRLEQSTEWHRIPQRFFLYDLTEEGVLFSEDLEACLYIGLLFLASRQYKAALHYFRHFCQKTSPYTKYEKELLEWGIKLSDKNSDYHIQAFSVRLYLAWLKFYNAETYADSEAFLSESRSYWFRLAAQLSEYAEKPLQASNLALEKEAEVFLLKKILLYVPSEVLMKRLSKLTHGTASQSLPQEHNPEVMERKALIASKLPASLTTLLSTTPRTSILFTRPGWNFMERFMHNYAVILLPEHEDKERLRQQLIFIHNDPHPEIRLLGRILEVASRNPQKFPSIEEMHSILHTDNTTAFRKKVIVPTLQRSFRKKRKKKPAT